MLTGLRHSARFLIPSVTLGRNETSTTDGATVAVADARVTARNASQRRKWIGFGYKAVLVVAVVLAGGCGGAGRPRCGADLMVDGVAKHFESNDPTEGCAQFAFTGGVFDVQLWDAADDFTITVPTMRGDFDTSPGNGGFTWNGHDNVYYGAGSWVRTGRDWEITFCSDDAKLGGSIRGFDPQL